MHISLIWKYGKGVVYHHVRIPAWAGTEAILIDGDMKVYGLPESQGLDRGSP